MQHDLIAMSMTPCKTMYLGFVFPQANIVDCFILKMNLCFDLSCCPPSGKWAKQWIFQAGILVLGRSLIARRFRT
jgi:hypothetical protein